MDDWYEKRDIVLKRRLNQNGLEHSWSLNYSNFNNHSLNHNDVVDHTKWDYSLPLTHNSQSKY